jgi:anaerobic ribonucleoside-triphosphate reductase
MSPDQEPYASLKNNLIFTNLAEQPTEDVERELRTFIFEKLGIEHKITIRTDNIKGWIVSRVALH